MFKVRLILWTLAVLGITAVIGEDCLYEMQLWASEDPTKFYYCNPYTNQSALGDCLPETGFVRNATLTGCVPWVDWNDACVNKVDVATITCEGETFVQPHGAVNPGVFYLCIAQNVTAVPLDCPEVSMKTIVIFAIFAVGFTTGQTTTTPCFIEMNTKAILPTTTGGPSITTPCTTTSWFPTTTTGPTTTPLPTTTTWIPTPTTGPIPTTTLPPITTETPLTTTYRPTTVTPTVSPSGCLYSDQLWADVNPNLFYYCNSLNNQPTQQECPRGRGFLRNGILSGCVPFEQWPATCVTQVATAPSCTGGNVNRPSVATNPNEFYLCLAEGATPVLVQCNSGKGFLSTTSTLGCVDWAQWRELKNCNID